MKPLTPDQLEHRSEPRRIVKVYPIGDRGMYAECRVCDAWLWVGAGGRGTYNVVPDISDWARGHVWEHLQEPTA